MNSRFLAEAAFMQSWGLTTLVAGIKHASALAVPIVNKPEWDEVNRVLYVWKHEPQFVVQTAVELLVGVLLLLGRDAIVRSWSFLRGREPYVAD